MDDICQILNEVTVNEIKDFRKNIDIVIGEHGFTRVRTLGPKHFVFRLLKTNRRLIKFLNENFGAKFPDLADDCKLHLDTFCKIQKGALSVTMMTIPSHGLVFYSANEEHGLSAYLVSLDEAIALHDRVARDGIGYDDMQPFIG